MKKLILIAALFSLNHPAIAHDKAEPHVKDKPLPATQKTMKLQPMATLIHNDKRISEFSKLLHEANMEDMLNKPGAITVFAPTNLAMANLDKSFRNDVWEDVKVRKAFIMSHIFAGKMTSDYLPKLDSLRSLSAKKILVSNKKGGLKSMLFNGASIVAPDINASNGIVHLISSSFAIKQEK